VSSATFARCILLYLTLASWASKCANQKEGEKKTWENHCSLFGIFHSKQTHSLSIHHSLIEADKQLEKEE